MTRILILITLLNLYTSFVQASEVLEIKLGIISNDLKEYRNTFKDQKCEDITDFKKTSNRSVIELILLCKSLHLSGLKFRFNFVQVPNYVRAILLSKSGKIDLIYQTVWNSSAYVKDHYLTKPVIRDGEFEKGVYVLKSNKPIQEITSLKDLSKFTALSSSEWIVDWNTLKLMNVPKTSTSTPESMFKMIKARRADYLLYEFTSEQELKANRFGITLYPVKGIKVGLKGSRHFAVSKKSKRALMIFASIEKGLKKLRSKGIITKAFRESGFLNPKVRDWKKIF